MNNTLQDRIKIILMEPSHPGNIGAAARAMKNMGFSKLCLVKPNKFPHLDATVRASGADDILAKAEVVDTLIEAIGGCDRVYGTSARARTLPWPLLTPRSCADDLKKVAYKNIGIVFGRESSGLTNEELSLCQVHVHIPTEADFSSLNLAAAVQVICYEIKMATIAASDIDTQDSACVNVEQLAGLCDHFRVVLTRLGILDPNHPRMLMQRIQRLFNRSALEINELNILRGMLSSVEKHLDSCIMANPAPKIKELTEGDA